MHFLCENILTENVDIINRLCKEVEDLMHLLQGVKSDGAEPFGLPDHHCGCSHTRTHARTHARTHKHRASPHKQRSDKVFVCLVGI